MDISVSPIEEMYARMVKVIEDHGGSAPKVNESGSLTLISDFCWALNVKPEIILQPITP